MYNRCFAQVHNFTMFITIHLACLVSDFHRCIFVLGTCTNVQELEIKDTDDRYATKQLGIQKLNVSLQNVTLVIPSCYNHESVPFFDPIVPKS